MSSEAKMLRALTDAVLALYGEREPYALETLDDISERLHGLADQKRSEAQRQLDRDVMKARDVRPRELLGPTDG